MRKIATIAILVACMTVSATAQISVIQPSGPAPAKEVRTFALQNNGNIKIENISGDITIATWDKNEVALTAIFTPSVKNEYAKIEVDAKNNSLEFVVKYPKEKQEIGSCDMELTVPHRINSYIKTTTGSIELDTIDGNHQVHTVVGDIAFDIGGGAITASSTTGHIYGTIQKNEGNLSASTTTGSINIKLYDTNGVLNANTTVGRVVLDAPKAKDASVKGNSASATFGDGGAKITLSSTSGSIVVQ